MICKTFIIGLRVLPRALNVHSSVIASKILSMWTVPSVYKRFTQIEETKWGFVSGKFFLNIRWELRARAIEQEWLFMTKR